MGIRLLRTALPIIILGARVVAGQAAHPVVHVLGTGGTIGSAGGYWTGSTTRVSIDSLVKSAGMDSVATVESEQFFNVSSLSIGPVRWLELGRRIAELFQSRPDLSGLVITHGTDTMEETAYFLDLTVAGDRPVVVTGSMRPSNMAGADGPANLTNAVRAAASPASRGRGTMVLMDDRLFSARDVTKTNSTRVETFQAPDRGPLAIVDPEGLFFRSKSAGRATAQFDVSTLRDLPRVDIIYAFPGADSVAIYAVVAAGAKGIVVAGVGRGGATQSQNAALRKATNAGVAVVMTTRTGSGRVPTGSGDIIGAGDLNAQKARVLLMLALTRTSKTDQLRRIFDENQ